MNCYYPFKKYALLLLLPIFFGQCNIGPGEGGSSSITGKVWIQEINSGGILVNEYYVQDERVYLIFGDGTTYDEEFRTSYDGSYQFNFLLKGTYQVFAYSECLGCDGGQEAIIKEVTIQSNGEEVIVDDIIIINYI